MKASRVDKWNMENPAFNKLGFLCENHRTKYGTFQKAMFDYRGVFKRKDLVFS
jgi:hypothetical protein